MADTQLVETHLSLLLLTDDRVLKWKKPVAFDFVDLRTLDARRRNCEREVELNRRLAPDVYEGVAELRGPGGELWEPVVVMRRLPDDRRLATLVRRDDPAVDASLAALAELLAQFHRDCPRRDGASSPGQPAAVGARWDANLRQIRDAIGAGLALPDSARGDLDTVARLSAAWLAGRVGWLRSRVEDGHVVDGHGDLQADDVFLLDRPVVIDCLEFDDDLRAVDVADDVAFLAMDLERLGRPDLAATLVERYDAAAEAQGRDPLPPPLVDMWAAYRAVVRAMVTGLRAVQEEPGSAERDRATADAAALLGLARRRLEVAEVRLVLVGGSPGTGKSKLARGLGAALGWPVIRTDEVRRRMGAAGAYDEATVDRVYAAAADEAQDLLERGRSVVLDATWGDARRRARPAEVAAATSARLVEIRCVVDPETAAARVARRAEKGHDASEATPEVARRLAARFDAWDGAVEIDTSGPAAATLQAGLGALGAHRLTTASDSHSNQA